MPRISIASFNLYNFQISGERTYGSAAVSAEEFEGKKEWIRSMLKTIDADVVAFQELWHPDALNAVLDDPELSDYKTVFIGDSWYGISVAMIVRSPWKLRQDAEVIKQFPFSQLVKVDADDGEDDELNLDISRFSRSILKVQLEHEHQNDSAVTVFACHLKSKLPARVGSEVDAQYRSAIGSALATIRRTAEATALRMMLVDHMEGDDTPVIVLGDLNDDPLSNTLSIITDQPTITNRARGSDKALYSSLHFQQLQSYNDVYYTHEHKNHKNVIDHILVSEEFFEYSDVKMWRHDKTQIWNDHIEDDNPYSSDHGIIKSSFI